MPSEKLIIGFAYDNPVDAEDAGSVSSEYEDGRTIEWLYRCLSKLGEVIRLPWGKDSLSRLVNYPPDVIFNITEAEHGRNRESLVPALAEALGIPYTGTDAVGLGLSLDKYIAKVIARQEGIPTPPFLRIDSLSEIEIKRNDIEKLGYPLFVKPVTGGSSQGIRSSAKVESLESLRNEVAWIIDNCHDTVLAETFIKGREFCVGLLEKVNLECLPVAELQVDKGNPESFYSFELKSSHRKNVICPADLSPEIVLMMEEYSFRIFKVMGCRDLARVDFRLGDDGVPYFLEINPLPGLSPFYSIFMMQADAGGVKPEKVIEILINNALSRG